MARLFVGPGEYGHCPGVLPDIYAISPGDIDPVRMYEEHGIRAWMLDLDGTFVPARAEHRYPVPEHDERFLERIYEHPELAAVIGTNRWDEEELNGWYGPTLLSKMPIFFGSPEQKPHPAFFDPVFSHFAGLGIGRHEVAVMGDGLSHDIAGAKNVDAFSVLVARLDPERYFAEFADLEVLAGTIV